LVCATFPLIFVGGLVTTTDAGMAVPDWPTTYGYNMFLYPWQSWLAAPWDLFVEHGHRLFGALVGVLTIALLVTLWRCDGRRSMVAAGWIALAAVVFQGVLGGLRVTENSRTLAMVHGCFGPVFFAYCVAIAVLTSRWWRDAVDASTSSTAADPRKLHRLSLITAALAYAQLLLGAQLRHADPVAPQAFQTFVVLHVFLAMVLLVHGVLIALRALRQHRGESHLLRPALGLGTLMVAQVALGAGSWLLKYGWPAWFAQLAWAQAHLSVEGSLPQVLVTTSHVAIGSLIVATSVLLTLRSGRLLPARVASSRSRSPIVGAAA
jgi:cytochrome c oxidase assembly protein subunit 15